MAMVYVVRFPEVHVRREGGDDGTRALRVLANSLGLSAAVETCVGRAGRDGSRDAVLDAAADLYLAYVDMWGSETAGPFEVVVDDSAGIDWARALDVIGSASRDFAEETGFVHRDPERDRESSLRPMATLLAGSFSDPEIEDAIGRRASGQD